MDSSNNNSSILRPSNVNSPSLIDLTESSHSNFSSKSSSLDTNALTSEKVKNLLLCQKYKYQIMKNPSPSSAEWWRSFGFPAQLNQNNQLVRTNLRFY
jgi:hypothetical protein